MNQKLTNPSLKEINAFKKKLNWGEVPAIYHLVATSIGDLDGILTHGFESGYKNILNRNTWNLDKLDGQKDQNGKITVKIKPKIALRHVFNDMGYELHCYPIVYGERLNKPSIDEASCPFIKWIPEIMRRLFRINSLASYMIFAIQSGDEADIELIKYAYLRVESLIETLRESFDIVDIRGFDIAEFFHEVDNKRSDENPMHLIESTNQEPE